MLVHQLVNLLVALVWGVLAYFCTLSTWAAHELSWKTLFLAALTIRTSSLPILFLTRRPAKVTSGLMKEWVVAIIGTFIGFFYNSNESYSLFASDSQGIIYVFLTIAIILSIGAILSLGRSFGIVPANRGVQTTGLYAVVRHPIYGCYIIFDLMFITLRLSWFNVIISLVFICATYLRANYEERLLGRDPLYQAYAKQTPYMFFPGVL